MDNLQGEGTVWEIEFGMEFCIVGDIESHRLAKQQYELSSRF